MTTVDELDKRSTGLEALFTDFPEMVNLRFDTVVAAQSELTARMNLLDRQLATLTRDVRDMRAAITRQLLGQDERFAAVEQRLDGLEQRMERLEQRMERLEQRLDVLDRRFTSLEAKLDQVIALLSPRS